MDVGTLNPLYEKEDWSDEDWKTWEDARGKEYEEDYEKEQLLAVGKGTPKGKWKKGKGKGKGGKGDKGKGKGKTDTWVENRDCHNCGVKGHLSFQCPQPKKPKGAGRGAAAAATAPETPATAAAAVPKTGRMACAVQRPARKPDADGFIQPKKTVLAITPKLRLCPMTVKPKCANSFCIELSCTDHLTQENISSTAPSTSEVTTTTNTTTRSAISEAFKAGTLGAKKKEEEKVSQWQKTHK